MTLTSKQVSITCILLEPVLQMVSNFTDNIRWNWVNFKLFSHISPHSQHKVFKFKQELTLDNLMLDGEKNWKYLKYKLKIVPVMKCSNKGNSNIELNEKHENMRAPAPFIGFNQKQTVPKQIVLWTLVGQSAQTNMHSFLCMFAFWTTSMHTLTTTVLLLVKFFRSQLAKAPHRT